jgi:hypothetical protein
MEIVIERFGSYHHAVSGRLLVDGQHVCDTLEEDVPQFGIRNSA